MKKLVKSLLIAVLVIPCAAVFTACGGGSGTSTGYKLQSGDHYFNESYGYSIKTGKTDYDYFSYTDEDLETILDNYSETLYTDYISKLPIPDNSSTEYDKLEMQEAVELEINSYLSLFNDGRSFVITPSTTDEYSGSLKIMTSSEYDATNRFPTYTMTVTVDSENGAMQITGAPGEYMETDKVSYIYNNGSIYAQIDAAAFVREIAESKGISATYNSDISPLWFELRLW